MLYRVKNTQIQISKKGTTYWTADLTDDNGQEYERVAAFQAIFKDGQSLDGFLESEVYNGKTSYKFTSKPAVTSGGKTGQIERVMEKKNESIASFQDNKERSIQHAGAITNATNLTVAMINAHLGDYSTMSPLDVKEKLRENIIFYQNLYKFPSEINPSASDDPFGTMS